MDLFSTDLGIWPSFGISGGGLNPLGTPLLSHPVLLYNEPYCSQTNNHNLIMIQAILNRGVSMEL
jgi:hypothetical protein